jgi:hypothetical protein
MRNPTRREYMHKSLNYRRGQAIGASLALAGACAGWLPACSKNTTLRGETVRHVVVGTVTDQGIVLDENATPKQVTYVLLRAIRDDVLADGDREAREAAFDRQLNVCAPEAIFGHYRRFFGSYPVERDESGHKCVRAWAPTLARYVGSFDLDWPTAEQRLVQLKPRTSSTEDRQSVSVLLEAADPNPDIAGDASVVIRIELAQENGFWRVSHVGFHPRLRHLGRAPRSPSTQPAADPRDS